LRAAAGLERRSESGMAGRQGAQTSAQRRSSYSRDPVETRASPRPIADNSE